MLLLKERKNKNNFELKEIEMFASFETGLKPTEFDQYLSRGAEEEELT